VRTKNACQQSRVPVERQAERARLKVYVVTEMETTGPCRAGSRKLWISACREIRFLQWWTGKWKGK
jgi:hypothetical protein